MNYWWIECMNEWMNEWMNQSINQSINGWKNHGLMNDKLMDLWWMNDEYIHEWMNDEYNKWMNERMMNI